MSGSGRIKLLVGEQEREDGLIKSWPYSSFQYSSVSVVNFRLQNHKISLGSLHRNGQFKRKTDLPDIVLQLGSSQVVVNANDDYHEENINELKNVCFGEAGSSVWKINDRGQSVLTGLMTRFEKGCGGFFTDHANPQRLINLRIISYVQWILGRIKNDPLGKCHPEDHSSSSYGYGRQGRSNGYLNFKQQGMVPKMYLFPSMIFFLLLCQIFFCNMPHL